MARTLATKPLPRTAVFSRPGFARVYIVGVVWSLCRWAIGFLGAYVVAETTGSPRLVQLTGALLWAPLLLTGVFGGAVSDRFPRKAVLFVQFGVLGPLTAGVGALLLWADLPLPILYLYMVVAGFGWVVDMTVRRALVYDLVGDDHIDAAMAFEGLASAFGLVAGALGGGALIAVVGAGGAYLAVASAILVAALALSTVPALDGGVPALDGGVPALDGELSALDGGAPGEVVAETVIRPDVEAQAGGETGVPSPERPVPPFELPPGQTPPARAAEAETKAEAQVRPSIWSEMVDGIRLVGRQPRLASVLGITALVNFFHFSYFPIVPVIAQRVDATPFTTGLLAAATGVGMAVGALVILRTSVPRGAAYVTGAVGGMVFLIGFGAFDDYWPVFASLLVASSFIGLFAATQSALVMTSVDTEMRGRAMGLLSMAIGMLPVGMAVLGEVSELIGAPTALILSNTIGLVAILVYIRRRPEAFRTR